MFLVKNMADCQEWNEEDFKTYGKILKHMGKSFHTMRYEAIFFNFALKK
jgi:hypothetical protein